MSLFQRKISSIFFLLLTVNIFAASYVLSADHLTPVTTLENDFEVPYKIQTIDEIDKNTEREDAKLKNIGENSKRPELDLNYIFSDSLTKPIMLEAKIDVPMMLNLQNTLEHALASNLEIIQARQKLSVDKWKWIENVGNFLPDYSLNFDFRRFDGTFLIGGVFPVDTLTSSINTNMRVDYMVFQGGMVLFNTYAQRKFYESSKENVQASLNDILLKVTIAYYNLLREQSHLDVLAKSVEKARENLKLNQNLEKQGVGTKFNVLQSEAQLAEEEQAFISQQSRFRQASIELSKYLNFNQSTHIEPDINDLLAKKLYDINKPIEEIINLAKTTRPELKKLNLEYSAKRKYIGAAFSEYLPTANVFAQFGGSGKKLFDSSSTTTVRPDGVPLNLDGNPIPAYKPDLTTNSLFQVSDPFSDGQANISNVVQGGGRPFRVEVDESLMSSNSYGFEVNWLIGKGLGVPTLSKIKQAKYEADIQKTKIEKLTSDLEGEVRSAYLNVQTAERLLEVSEKRVSAATEALRLSKLRLENGIGINTELLNAQTQYKNSLASKVDAIVEYNNAQAKLLHSVGIIDVKMLIGS